MSAPKLRHHGATVVVVGVLALALVACTPPPGGGGGSPTTTSTTTTTVPKHVMSVGHADMFAVRLDGGSLDVVIEDDSGPTPVDRDPARTILHARPESQTSVPNPPGAFSFLGTGGATVWILPQVQNPSLLWPGASTEEIPTGALQGNAPVSWTVLSVSGPGGFHVFQSGAFGAPQMWFTSGAAFPQTKQLGVPSHVHFNWAFGAVGTYTVVMRANATLADGTPVSSGPVTYTFRVGPI
jgi:surface-anchored protein